MSVNTEEKTCGDIGMQNHVHSHDHEHSHTHSHPHTQTKAVMNRLSKAIGHLQSVKRMVEDGKDCSEVLIQLAAVRSALAGTARLILKDHMENCVVDIIDSGDTSALQQLHDAIDMLLK